MGGHKTRIRKEDHAFVLLSLVLIKAKRSRIKRDVWDVATETKVCREPTQYGVLPVTASGWTMICTMMCKPHRLPCRSVSPALARSCSAARFWRAAAAPCNYTGCTQNTDITDIMQGRQGPALHVQYDSSAVWGVASSNCRN